MVGSLHHKCHLYEYNWLTNETKQFSGQDSVVGQWTDTVSLSTPLPERQEVETGLRQPD